MLLESYESLVDLKSKPIDIWSISLLISAIYYSSDK